MINWAAFCSMAGQIPMLHFPARATGGHVDNTANRWQDTREIFSPNWVENWHPDMYRSFPSIYQEKTEWKIFSLMHIITCLVILQFLFTTTNIFQLLSIWDLICICCSIPWTNLRKNNIFNQMKFIFYHYYWLTMHKFYFLTEYPLFQDGSSITSAVAGVDNVPDDMFGRLQGEEESLCTCRAWEYSSLCEAGDIILWICWWLSRVSWQKGIHASID